MSIRFAMYIRKKRREGKLPFIDVLHVLPYKPIYGVPIGGIGCGSIGRGFRGEFCRFQMVPGIYEHQVVPADQFTVCIRQDGRTIHQQVLSPRSCRPPDGALGSWRWDLEDSCVTYHALYPRAWTVYDVTGQPVRLVCRQISPIIPHDYKDSSLPAAVFVWSVENKGSADLEVSIMFTFKNGQGTADDLAGGVSTAGYRCSDQACPVRGVRIKQRFRNMPCSYDIAALSGDQTEVTTNIGTDRNYTPSACERIWDKLFQDGCLDDQDSETGPTKHEEEVLAAVCARKTVPGGETCDFEFALTWHMPVIEFGGKGAQYRRRYTRWYGAENPDSAAAEITSYALNNFASWERSIEEWQNPILNNTELPSWYKSALFNELYYLSDGGTVWLNSHVDQTSTAGTVASQHREEYGKFAYLEGHEYRMYNTYDVHHYASYALITLWPELQLSLQYDIADSIGYELPETVRFMMGNTAAQIKASGAVPHDLGDPEEEPWIKVNAYIMHPTNEWKDLNTKFILQVYRDFTFTREQQYLKHMYQYAKEVIENCLRWDKDGDGLIENGGFADQTFDAWVVTGPSAYCGSLWLAALYMMSQMADVLEAREDRERYLALLKSGKSAYIKKLWNGRYYNYDSSAASYNDSVMADQLNGHWFLKACGVPDNEVFPKDQVISALKTIFELNVLSFRRGTMGAINGMRPNGKKDTTSLQSEEFWPGVIYGLAATMIHEGLMDEGWQTAYGAYHTVYEQFGLGFQTPEAYTEEKKYRSLGYMRPLSIWAIHHALQQQNMVRVHSEIAS